MAALLLGASGDVSSAGPPAVAVQASAGKARADRAPSLRWPLEFPPSVGSSFGEYRYDHLHAGIDISTAGGTGYKVRAAAAGEVFRLKVEWRGYGRALYLRHPGGRVTVYAHLERYEDRVLRLERLVARRQAEAGTRYPGDIYLERPLRVARGQLLAYSGESGVGLPHLHFEVRDGGDAPVDPFEAGLTRPADRRPPVLESLTLTAASPASFIEGEAREMTYPLVPGAGGVLTTARSIRLNGPFLASLAAYDPVGDSGRAGIRSIEMAIDGELRYRLALRSFRFDQYPQAGLVFDHRFSRLAPAAFAYRLYRLPGNEFASGPAGAGATGGDVYPGAYELPPGSHSMTITVADRGSIRARARVCIQVGGRQALEEIGWDGGMSGPRGVRFRLPADALDAKSASAASPACPSPALQVEAGLWEGMIRAFRPLTCRPEEGLCPFPDDANQHAPSAVRVREILNGAPGPWRLLVRDSATAAVPDNVGARVEAWPASLDILATLEDLPGPSMRLATGLRREILDDLAYRNGLTYGAALAYSLAAGRAPFFIVADRAPAPLASLALDTLWIEKGQKLDYAGPGFTLHLPENARFYSGPVALRTERIPGSEGLPSIADAVEILPEGEALQDRATLSFEVAPGVVAPETLGIYRWDASRRRWMFEGGDLEDGGSRLSLRFRRYGRFALLQDASPPDVLEIRPAAGARLAGPRPALTARVEDEGKGLDYDGVVFELDGRRLESEFDPDRGVSRVLDPPRLSPGTHRLKVVATDRAGNASPPREAEFAIKNR